MTKAVISSSIPTELITGQSALNRIKELEILEEFKFHAPSGNWILHIKLSPFDLAFNDFVPGQTEWFVFVDSQYPFGSIDFYPSKKNGIDKTFPHQALNIESDNDQWRLGKICLSDPFAAFEDSFFSSEPYTDEERLAWHIKRALGWLQYASKNELLAKGHFFEMPVFENQVGNESLLVFSESDYSFDIWQNEQSRFGFFEYYITTSDKPMILVKKFLSTSKKPLLIPNWGDYIKGFQKPKKTGIWIKLDSLPLIPPWQAPLTWGELKICLQRQNIDLNQIIDKLYSIRKGKERIDFIALFGFPIPDKIGEEFKRYHWQGVQLPTLKFRDSSIKGYRSSREAAQFANRNMLSPTLPIEWIESENWFPDQIRSRGSLPSTTTDKKILLIGAGAVGSAISEMLVRGGIDRLTISDGDEIKAGNLVRHTLDLRYISQNKATALCSHLNQISPFAKIRQLGGSFPPKSGFNIDNFDLIIDCTASQKMLSSLSGFESQKDKDFISISMSFGAKRLYFYSSNGKRFPFEHYRNKIVNWLEKDFEENKNESVPREGIGCWHPVFPARSDEVWLLASTGFKLMIQYLNSQHRVNKLRIFEQEKDGLFDGIKETFLD